MWAALSGCSAAISYGSTVTHWRTRSTPTASTTSPAFCAMSYRQAVLCTRSMIMASSDALVGMSCASHASCDESAMACILVSVNSAARVYLYKAKPQALDPRHGLPSTISAFMRLLPGPLQAHAVFASAPASSKMTVSIV